ncbi:hypothetical protein CC86DRAFT_354984 [Ophiobolus disseminans]|uniref:Uncharacterized protein n=1 Tax=Ophiobolus disseminans TaxID=1469910 RepID=A0A6A6ZTI1_9PLEO|nr:hypothetical protein CC86DRAFT_354984 [Ophiobolus disseminans]
MYLLWYNDDDDFFSLVNVEKEDVPRYAILSHTWGPDKDELTFQEVVKAAGVYHIVVDEAEGSYHKLSTGRDSTAPDRIEAINKLKEKPGYDKVQFCGRQAKKDGIDYIWVDSCCIDRSSSAELSEALNSMFCYYRDAARCYVYLADFSFETMGGNNIEIEEWGVEWSSAFQNSRWFTRGWTVQELLAPKFVDFFSTEGMLLGERSELSDRVSKITSIPVNALQGVPLAQFEVEERLSWAAGRLTKREEDSAYALLGLFGVFMSPIYGEGKTHAMKRLRETIQQAEGKAERDLMKSLQFDQMSLRETNIKDAHRETCQWLLRQPEYIDWLEPTRITLHRGLLWIKGKPGAGKSTIMKFAHSRAIGMIEEVNHTSKGKGDSVVIAFFFNARGVLLERSTLGMYRSLLAQLLERRPYLQKALRLLPFPATLLNESYPWSIGTLQDLFRKAILSVKTPVVCFIDALDECEEKEVRDMLSFLTQLGEVAEAVKVTFHVCLASRHYPHISIDRGIQLILERQEGHARDISEYLNTELRIGHSKQAIQIRDEAQRKASGVFMWVALVVGILNKAYDSGRIHALQKILHNIPSDLHNLFRDILTRDSDNKSELTYCIEWILFAAEPLTPEELYFAILSGAEPGAHPEWDEDEIPRDALERFILNCSKGLAQITTTEEPKVQFIHESVRDFLLKDDGMDHVRSNMGDDFVRLSHSRLARCCTLYMRLSIDPHLEDAADSWVQQCGRAIDTLVSPLDRYPFLRYAIWHMNYHVHAAGQPFTREEYGSREQSIYPHVHCVDLDVDLSNGAEKEEEEMSMMAVFAHHSDSRSFCFGSVATKSRTIVRTFAEDVYATNTPDFGRVFQENLSYKDCAYPLMKELSASLVRIRQFDSRTKNPNSQLPLTWAVEYDKDRMLKFFVGDNLDINFNASYSHYGNVLTVASAEGSMEQVRLLLDAGVDVNFRGGYYGNALQAAVARNSEPIVKLLLARGADIEAIGGNAERALYAASARGHTEMVALLLKHGADVSAPGQHHNSALHAARKNNRHAVIELLQDAIKNNRHAAVELLEKPDDVLYTEIPVWPVDDTNMPAGKQINRIV